MLKDFEKYVAKGLKDMNVAGAAVAIVKDGEVILAEGYGYADLENKVKLTADHILPIGSATKAFTSTCAVMLAGEGKLDLDKPVRDYMPEFQLYDKTASDEATARDLMCHRTGMPRHDLMWIGWDDIERRDVVSKYLRHLPNNKPFRSVWQYQNHMFASSGYLVEKISGQTWEEMTKERIFGPLDMKSAGFRMQHPDKTGKYAKLYVENQKTNKNEECVPLTIDGMGPAGSITSSVRDMANWVLFNINKGKVGEKELVAEKAFAELHKPNIPYELSPIEIPERKIMGYGLGWFVDCYRGEKLIEHGGNVNGASALVAFMPEKNIGCVVLTNAHGTSLTRAIVYDVFDRLLGVKDGKNWVDFLIESAKPLKEAGKKQTEEFYKGKIKGKKPLHAEEEYLGVYTHPGYGDITIYKSEDGKLRLKRHDNDDELTHMHYDIFYIEFMKVMPIGVSFKTGLKGEIESLSAQFEPMLPPSVFVKKQEENK